jgi:hypothetical protein
MGDTLFSIISLVSLVLSYGLFWYVIRTLLLENAHLTKQFESESIYSAHMQERYFEAVSRLCEIRLMFESLEKRRENVDE